MGVYNSYYVVNVELIKKRLTEQFDLIGYIEDNLVLFHEYNDLPFWRFKIKFELNKGWYPSQEILNELDTTQNRILRKITSEKKSFPDEANLYYNEPNQVKEIWQELKKVSIFRVEELLSNKEVRDKIKKLQGYNINWIENHESMIENIMKILEAYYEAQSRGQGIVNFIE